MSFHLWVELAGHLGSITVAEWKVPRTRKCVCSGGYDGVQFCTDQQISWFSRPSLLFKRYLSGALTCKIDGRKGSVLVVMARCLGTSKSWSPLFQPWPSEEVWTLWSTPWEPLPPLTSEVLCNLKDDAFLRRCSKCHSFDPICSQSSSPNLLLTFIEMEQLGRIMPHASEPSFEVSILSPTIIMEKKNWAWPENSVLLCSRDCFSTLRQEPTLFTTDQRKWKSTLVARGQYLSSVNFWKTGQLGSLALWWGSQWIIIWSKSLWYALYKLLEFTFHSLPPLFNFNGFIEQRRQSKTQVT